MPYGIQSHQFQPVEQPANGLLFIDGLSSLSSLDLPPGSTSQPYFLKDEDKFAIVFTDDAGGSRVELFSFTRDGEVDSSTVTKADLAKLKAEILEAVNGEHAVQPE